MSTQHMVAFILGWVVGRDLGRLSYAWWQLRKLRYLR